MGLCNYDVINSGWNTCDVMKGGGLYNNYDVTNSDGIT